MKSDTLIEQLLTEDPVLLARDHRDLRHAILRGTEAGRLRRLLPGVYVDAGRADELAIRAAAVARWDRSAVICGRAAAALTYWPEIAVGPLVVASPVRHAGQRGFTFVERRIPTDLVREVEHVRTTVPALTAVEVATSDFTDPIDVALRKRVASLSSMHEAIELTSHRRGHTDRRRVLLDSRDEPWSAAERLAQRLYRRAGITGWATNLKTVVPDVGTYYLDIAFRRERVASEIDGRLHETDVDLFESDRIRQNALMLRGWLVLRFTWHMLDSDPAYVIATTQEALALRGTNGGVHGAVRPRHAVAGLLNRRSVAAQPDRRTSAATRLRRWSRVGHTNSSSTRRANDVASTNDLKNGMVLDLDGQLWSVVWFQHHKPGKGNTVVRTKLKHVLSGKVVDRTFNSDTKVDTANVDRREMQYLYHDGAGFVFMDISSYEQLSIADETVGDAKNYLLEGQNATVAIHEENPLYLDLPASVELEITYTEPGLQGDRSTGGTKPATVETGLQIQVPLFLTTGEKVKVDTRTGDYLGRVGS